MKASGTYVQPIDGVRLVVAESYTRVMEGLESARRRDSARGVGAFVELHHPTWKQVGDTVEADTTTPGTVMSINANLVWLVQPRMVEE